MSQAGARLGQVPTGGADADFPVISHDRKTVAYLRTEGDNRVMHLVGVNGANDRPVLAEPDPRCADPGRPIFAPGDDQLLVVCHRSSSKTSFFLMPIADGKLPRKPLVSGDIGDPTFAPGGKRVAFWRKNASSAGASLVIMSLGSGDIVDAYPADPGADDNDPAWSQSDGNLIAFRRRVADRADIFLLDVRAQTVARLLDGQGNFDQDPNWSPDGKEIAFKRNTSDARVWIVTIGENPQAHPLDEANIVENTPAWSPR
jgi:Tol biopolymer transport system component